ncbi:unnamed protein product [Linum tenue]|uniref:Endonuclease/exonuclease/phosphatase domain-containing protein n=1 Tax=Linum tenue TaxID=586396 RepID=A0AAV0HGH1_9ROSI|nr:unnamed protein product [Linum tenue]CAI0547885.1 unnamed protein product [Linum tenue]
MREGKPQAPNEEQSKYKRSDESAEHCLHEHRSKKRKVVSDAQTLTLQPHLDFPTVNRFAPINSSSSRRRRRNRYRSREPITLESNRSWVSSSHDPAAFADRLVLVSYNILGVENALKHPDLYSQVPREFLKWGRRKRLICKEIKQYNAGILCFQAVTSYSSRKHVLLIYSFFQEVDRFNDLDSLLQKDGFRGVYTARTGEACDGCAMFWKDEMYTLLHKEHIEFRNFGLRDNVAQLCVLQINDHQSEKDTVKQVQGVTQFLRVLSNHGPTGLKLEFD